MPQIHEYNTNLLEKGILLPELHYGAFARNWWIQKAPKNKETQSTPLIVPYRLNMRVSCELNEEKFIISVVQNKKSLFQPGFVCTCKEKSTGILSSASTAINTLYREIFGQGTEYSGPAAMGLYDKQIIMKLIQGVTFFPIYIRLQSFIIVVSNIGYSTNNECHGAGNGFTSSLLTKFQKKYSFVSQQIKNNMCILEIYHESEIVAKYEDETPTGVWKKCGVNKKFDGSDLFGVTDPTIQAILQNPPKSLRICTPNEWNEYGVLQEAFDQNIKSRKIGIKILLDWHSLFVDWLHQESTIIQIPKALQNIYPPDYQIQDSELRAWKAMFVACGCTNVTPFKKEKSDIEFWSRASNPSADKETLLNLYNAGLINLGNSPIIIDKSTDFWESFRCALNNNKRGLDGRIRILSIIAEKFRYEDLREKLQVGSTSINLARKHARINGPGALAIIKPKRKICRMSEIKEKEFELFFQDKSNVTMSSYKVDSKTNLPILYLQDQKKALWDKFEETYPNGMKKSSFMTRLANCSHIKYREDLGGLCSICNEYGFEAFQNLIAIARSTFDDKKTLDSVMNRIEKLRIHMKRNFERELVINHNGTISHDNCINHCLLYAFGECKQSHTSRCTNCDEFFVFFDFLNSCIPSEQKVQLDQIKERLKYYLSHQVRKVFLNAQFKSSLAQLDEDGAIIVADYKMRILPKSARETKEQFFGKRGWTLHTILIFTKKENETKLDVRAYDHWSTDTKQDAWFTASSFEATFGSMEKVPKWIRVISDNGPHYHNSELMSIVAHWYDWYQIEVHSWLFLEPGEAKTTIDSHHASVSHAIKRYIRIGYDIKEGQDIVKAGKNLAGTYFANIEPNRTEISENSEKKKPKIKTIPGISKYFYWEWPVEGPLAGYIQARPLPHIGSWTQFSPAVISNLCNNSTVQPQPTVSTHTQASSNWTMPMPQLNVNTSQPNDNIENNLPVTNRNPNWQDKSIDESFQLLKGWALKEKHAFGGKGTGKRMSKKVKSLLELFFLNGNINARDKLNAQEMHDELLKYVESGEIEEQDVPKTSTIQGWISRYAAALKDQATKTALQNKK